MTPRTLLLTVLVSVAAGCGRGAPTMAHYRPVAHWVEALHRSDSQGRLRAVKVLANVGPADAAVIPALIEALGDDDASVRREAARAFVKFGSTAGQAGPALRTALADPDERVRTYAARALELSDK